ncbi:MAG: class II fructose-bisphosphatase [Reichenbachiella sp.]
MKQSDSLIDNATLKKTAKSLIEVVGQAALATGKYIGSGKKEEGDQAAVDAMRKAFDHIPIDGIVKVGEGEKDEAPMLYIGEPVGNGTGAKIDIAVDPVEGTALMANGLPNAITVLAATERNGFWEAGSAYYMNKIVVGNKSKGVVDITASTEENLKAIANALNKKITELCIYVLDKPRHKALIEEIKSLGAKVSLQPEGDVIGSVLALIPHSGIDVLMGIGGAPEAVITAAAVKVMNGDMQGQLAPQKVDEKKKLFKEGVDLQTVLTLDDLIKSEWAIFAAAGVTSGLLLNGVEEKGNVTEFLLLGPEENNLERGHFPRK